MVHLSTVAHSKSNPQPWVKFQLAGWVNIQLAPTIWGTLIAYNLIRLEIAKAALTVKCEPTEVSFIRAFHLIQFELHWAAVTRSYGKLPASMKHLRERLVSLLNDERPDRKCDRAVKARPNRYPVRVLRKSLN